MNRLAAAILLTPLVAGRAFSATITSTQSGSWSASATWGGNPAPGAGDAVIINGGFTVTVDVSDAACASLQLGGTLSNTGKGTIVFTSGSQLTVSGSSPSALAITPGASP